MGCVNLLSGPNSNHHLETTVYRPTVNLNRKPVPPEPSLSFQDPTNVGIETGKCLPKVYLNTHNVTTSLAELSEPKTGTARSVPN